MSKEKSNPSVVNWLIAILLIPIILTQFLLICQLEYLKGELKGVKEQVEVLRIVGTTTTRVKRNVSPSVPIDCSQCKSVH